MLIERPHEFNLMSYNQTMFKILMTNTHLLATIHGKKLTLNNMPLG